MAACAEVARIGPSATAGARHLHAASARTPASARSSARAMHWERVDGPTRRPDREVDADERAGAEIGSSRSRAVPVRTGRMSRADPRCRLDVGQAVRPGRAGRRFIDCERRQPERSEAQRHRAHQRYGRERVGEEPGGVHERRFAVAPKTDASLRSQRVASRIAAGSAIALTWCSTAEKPTWARKKQRPDSPEPREANDGAPSRPRRPTPPRS